jgi:hypothetical protein
MSGAVKFEELGNVAEMRRQGVSAIGFLIAIVVLFAAGLTLYFINRQVLRDDDRESDIKNMRSIYVATVLYENVNDGLSPPNLGLTENEVGDTQTFLASGDPFTAGSNFPVDPAFPDSESRSKFRVSFTYLPQWVERGKFDVKNWRTALQNPSLGLIACYWYGSAHPLRPDGLNILGDVVRINMDGSVRTLDRSRSKSLLTANSLFQQN